MTAEMPPKGFKALASSERSLLPGARQIGPVDPHERLEVSVYLRSPSASDPAGDSQLHARHPGQRMSRAEYPNLLSCSPSKYKHGTNAESIVLNVRGQSRESNLIVLRRCDRSFNKLVDPSPA